MIAAQVNAILTHHMPLSVMSNYRRPRQTDACIFFTVALATRGSDLLLQEIVRLRDAVRTAKQCRPFVIEAMVVLPDHIYAVWRMPADDSDYSVRWSAIKSGFSKGLPPGRLRDSHILRREKGIWQRRFWEHHLRTDSDRAAAIRYCWINPVKHGLVGDPGDWPYSSYRRDGGTIM